MRRMRMALTILFILGLAAPAMAEVFVTGPGMIGHPGADDPAVGYSSVALEEGFDFGESAFAPGGRGVPLRPWEELWYQLSQMPGV